MTNVNSPVREASILTLSFLAWQLGGLTTEANPTGGTVAQGSATISSSGSQLTINQSSSGAVINWSSFNIGVGETTTFIQPSSSSVSWNQINDANPSQILGNLNANGYVVLQNQSGFVVGGQAAISAHGLVMTTSPTPPPNLSSGGAWAFDAAPPSAEIINYGQINIAGGGPVFLIANKIENDGTISAPGGKIGLYAGEQVLVSTSPDGRGLSAKVTLPEGSVDNQGNLIADAGSIVAQAQTVNNNGLVQANSVQNNNGVIELVASDHVNLGANSDISARGDSVGTSAGGSVTIKSDNTLTDQAGSTINVAGGTQGGNGGELEISAPNLGNIRSKVNGHAAAGFIGAAMVIDPTTITLDASTESAYNSLITSGGLSQFTVSADEILVNSSWSTPGALAQLNIAATDDITFNTVWNLVAPGVASTLNLTAGNDIIFNNGSGIIAGNTGQKNWSINLTAGNDITLNTGTSIQANAGKISLDAVNVDLYGELQANSIGQANGVIDVNATANLTLEAGSVVEAQGDSSSASPSPGGFVTLQAGNTYSDDASSMINVAGAGGGQGGIVQLFGGNLDGTFGDNSDANSVHSTIGGSFATFINPYDLTLSSNPTGTSDDPNNNLDVNFDLSDLAAYSQIDLHALDNVELSSLWTLPNATTAASISLTAGNNISFDQGTGLAAGNNWDVNLTAGTALAPGSQPTSGNDGIYLNGGAYLQTQNGDISAWAANEVIIQDADLNSFGGIDVPSGAIRTLNGGSINVTAVSGDVNTGDNFNGYNFTAAAPYYTVNKAVGGISTAAGGNVTITAGGDVISYLPTQNDYNTYGSKYDAGTGAFGPEAGNVTITAGGSVFGNYVVADGTGIINAGVNAGLPVSINSLGADFALSLVKGSWSVNAQNIYLDDVINPNGVFNDTTTRKGSAGYHYFNYDPNASVSLDAADAVEITGAEVPLLPTSAGTALGIPVLFPPTLEIVTGAGGLTLDADVILFPSADGNLNITTLDGGDFISRQNPDDPYDFNTYSLQMSDSGNTQWFPGGQGEGTEIFGYGDTGSKPIELNNPNPVEINVSGNIENINIYTTKETDLTVGGDMFNTSLVGENLHASDTTSINVAGSISYSPIYTLTSLTQPIVGADPLDPTWDSIFFVLVDTTPGDNNSTANSIPAGDIGNNSALKALAASDLIFQSANPNPGFVYSPATKQQPAQLGFAFQMSSQVLDALSGTMKMIVLDSAGNPEIQLGNASLGQDPTQYYFVTTTVSFVPGSAVQALYNLSHGLNADGTPNPNGEISAPNAGSLSAGFQIGGPGKFDITAGTMDLGSSGGIGSWGVGNGTITPDGDVNYSYLAASLGTAADTGASITVDVAGNLGMLTSTIASLAGGSVTVDSGGEIDLGLASLPFNPPNSGNLAFGIYTSAGGNVNVTADSDINIDTARIGTFNGGNIFIESLDGDVNAGNGVNEDLLVPMVSVSKTGQIITEEIQDPRPYGSGILAISPTEQYQVSPGTVKGGGELPGNITVETPDGNIVSTLGGISQFALDGSIAGGPTISLSAGTPGVAASKTDGNIDLGQGGVIGGTVDLTAQGSISGLIVSRQNSTVTAAQNINVTVLSGGTANVSAGGNLSGTLIGVSGVNASGGAGISATMLSANVSANGGAAQSTLGTATASSESQSAANQSTDAAKQQLASDQSGDDDKKKKKFQALLQRIKRVTVILPKT